MQKVTKKVLLKVKMAKLIKSLLKKLAPDFGALNCVPRVCISY